MFELHLFIKVFKIIVSKVIPPKIYFVYLSALFGMVEYLNVRSRFEFKYTTRVPLDVNTYLEYRSPMSRIDIIPISP